MAGIPGSAVTALTSGAPTLHGLLPGPRQVETAFRQSLLLAALLVVAPA